MLLPTTNPQSTRPRHAPRYLFLFKIRCGQHPGPKHVITRPRPPSHPPRCRNLPPTSVVQRAVGTPRPPSPNYNIITAAGAPVVIDLTVESVSSVVIVRDAPPSPPCNGIPRAAAVRRVPHQCRRHHKSAPRLSTSPPTERELNIKWSRNICRRTYIHLYKGGGLIDQFDHCYICKKFDFKTELDFVRHIRSNKHLIQFYKLEPRKCQICHESREFATLHLWNTHLQANNHNFQSCRN